MGKQKQKQRGAARQPPQGGSRRAQGEQDEATPAPCPPLPAPGSPENSKQRGEQRLNRPSDLGHVLQKLRECQLRQRHGRGPSATTPTLRSGALPGVLLGTNLLRAFGRLGVCFAFPIGDGLRRKGKKKKEKRGEKRKKEGKIEKKWGKRKTMGKKGKIGEI